MLSNCVVVCDSAADCLGPYAGRIVSEASCSSAVKIGEIGTGEP